MPGFWHALVRQHGERVFSIDNIQAELAAMDDRLSDWVQHKAPETLFKQTSDKKVTEAYAETVNWVQRQPQFTPEAKAEFATPPMAG